MKIDRQAIRASIHQLIRGSELYAIGWRDNPMAGIKLVEGFFDVVDQQLVVQATRSEDTDRADEKNRERLMAPSAAPIPAAVMPNIDMLADAGISAGARPEEAEVPESDEKFGGAGASKSFDPSPSPEPASPASG